MRHFSEIPPGDHDRTFFDMLGRIQSFPLANFSERRALGVRKPQTSGDVGAKDSILRNQVFALEEQALIDQASHVRQQPCPSCCSA